MRFEFATAPRIVFGAGSLAQLGPLARELGAHALLVTGRTAARGDRAAGLLRAAGVQVTRCVVAREPTTDDIVAAVHQARAAGCDSVVGFGGGSALDAAKALAALLANPGDLFDYLEVIGRGRPLTRPALPCLAVPTTAGTGSEATRNAVLASPAHRVKVSLRSPLMLPRVALVDPELTFSLPPAITAATGLDALTQVIEPFVSVRANPMTDALCREGIARAARSLQVAWRDGANPAARADLALASLCGGIALANAGLGAVHGFAAPVGGMFAAPHGATCAALLAPVVAANLSALRARAPDSPALARYAEVARLLTGRPTATADEAAPWLRALVAELGIPPLGRYGIQKTHTDEIVAAARRASSMQANPIELTPAELAAVLAAAL